MGALAIPPARGLARRRSTRLMVLIRSISLVSGAPSM
jgi:hypothetical protein